MNYSEFKDGFSLASHRVTKGELLDKVKVLEENNKRLETRFDAMSELLEKFIENFKKIDERFEKLELIKSKEEKEEKVEKHEDSESDYVVILSKEGRPVCKIKI